MKSRRHIGTTPRELYLKPGTFLYVNRIAESFRLEEHTHEFLEFNYVSEGSGFQHIEGAVIPVAKGDLFLLPIGTSHVFRPAHAQPDKMHLIVYNCLFDPQYLDSLRTQIEDKELEEFLRNPARGQRWASWKDQDGVFQLIFNTLLEEFLRKRPHYRMLMQGEMLRLFAHLHRRQLSGQKLAAEGDEVMDNALRWLEQHAFGQVTVGQAAGVAGMSERHFRRRLYQASGMSYTEYVHKLRMEKCCRLLEETKEKVSVIAGQCGYGDIKFFNKLFKKKTGMTPRQYRAAYRRTTDRTSVPE